jgi:quercetin dioxygenase-like cupin family protein
MSHDHATSGTAQRPAHSLSGHGLTYTLSDEIQMLRKDLDRTSGGRAAKTLAKAGGLRVTLVLLQGGTTLDAQATAGGASLHVLEGQLRLQGDGNERTARQGDLIVLADNLRGSINADQQTAVLVTVAWPEGAGAWEQEARAGRL